MEQEEKNVHQKYPLGLQDFEGIRNKNHLYLDKTEYILKAFDISKYHFLSRPRRFGKSLLVNTIQAVFEGKKKLFAGLFIEDKWDWTQTNPVIKISFSNISHKEKGLAVAISDELDSIAASYQIQLDSTDIGGKFKELIYKLEPLGKVVVLIDEYDKPILDHLGKNTDLAVQNRDTMKSFYAILKDADAYLKLVFITGVTKFSKVSIFSELNNLTDLTMHPSFAGLCGITQTELEQNFKEELKVYDKEQIKTWYNGYTWDMKTRVYNPYSVLSFFTFGEFRNFWFETGTPTFLVNLMLDYALYDTEDIEVDSSIISEFNIQHLNPLSVLFQAGYVTLKDYDPLGDIYTLVSPNLEVRRSLQIVVLNAYRNNAAAGSVPLVKRLYNVLKNNELGELKNIFNQLFEALPYDLWEAKREKTYQAIIHLTFTLAGVYIQSEVHTIRGRLDSIIEFEDRVFIFEFKLDKTAEEALAQIESKGYANRFKAMGKICTGIGINFLQEKRVVEGILWKEV